ncbi:MAG: helix-turn-helix domain-containing protein [Pseudomonadota bacterium]
MKPTNGTDCPFTQSLKVLGDRWVLMIIRDLFVDGCCRFSDFQKTIEDINPTTLSNRLKLLEREGLIERRIYSDRPPRAEYHLTEAGRDLRPVLLSMMEWCSKHMGFDPSSVERLSEARRYGS